MRPRWLVGVYVVTHERLDVRVTAVMLADLHRNHQWCIDHGGQGSFWLNLGPTPTATCCVGSDPSPHTSVPCSAW